jgi:DNA invertase Pin-like site-specific DNA recombinase
MIEAISYKRFSSTVQLGGDSLRRQIALTEAYCHRQGLKLIDDYFDPGISAYHGANLNDGTALRALLDAAKDGKFRPGTYLVVESLDRLSRADMSVAVRLFLDLLDAGLVIVALIDGEQVFTKERVDNDVSAIVIAIILLMRANQESRVKRERQLQSHKARRDKARQFKLPMSKRCPSWLTVKGTGERRHFIVNQKRADIVENIFKLCVSGLGEHRTVYYLNQRGVRTFSGAALWRGSMVAKVLTNPAVFGLYRPCHRVFANGRMLRTPDAEGPIEDYYPSILSKELFEQAQRARRSRTTKRDGKWFPKRSNLFVGLGHCAICGSGLYLAQSAWGHSYLKCSKGYDWACSNRLGFPYRKLEAVFLALDDLLGLVRGLLIQRSLDAASADRDRDTPLGGQTGSHEGSEQERVFARFRAAKALMGSPRAPDAIEARVRLLGEVRRFCEGVVLHPKRVVTLHMRADLDGPRVTLIVGTDGLQGIQIANGTGEIGFISGDAVAGFVRPTLSGIGKVGADQLQWRPKRLKDVLERVRIVVSPGGDWQAGVHDPIQMAEIVERANNTLGAKRAGQTDASGQA